MIDLLIGTGNPGKLREYGEMLTPAGFRLLSLRDVGLASFELDEPYATFRENAVHKAQTFARAGGLLTLADDSGLCVDALDGRPGVYSARYAPGSDADRCHRLLAELAGMEPAQRTARFICVIAAARPDGAAITAEGHVEGRIALEPGPVINGFGYDSVFIPDGCAVVFSALPPGAKNALSHRGNALRRLIPLLTDWARR